MQMPSPGAQQTALETLKNHARKYRRRGISEFWGHFKANMLFVYVVKEAKSGLVGKVFGMSNVKGVGRLARLEYLNPDKWKLLIFKFGSKKYGPHPTFKERRIEKYVDATADIYIP